MSVNPLRILALIVPVEQNRRAAVQNSVYCRRCPGREHAEIRCDGRRLEESRTSPAAVLELGRMARRQALVTFPWLPPRSVGRGGRFPGS
jgi:hypothetical protein